MKNEFLEFLKSKEEPVPQKVSNELFNKITADLKPIVLYKLFFKILFLQFSAGALTLSVCPQFGIGPIGGGHGISYYFMQIGTWACASFCSLFYFGLSYSFALYFLKKTEFSVVRKKRYLFVSTVVTASILLFMAGKILNPNDTMFFNSEFVLIWFLSGLVITRLLLEVFSNYMAPSERWTSGS